jgi:hypothetical protein
MKFPLYVKTFAEGLKPYAGVSANILNIHGGFEAFIDTGSPWTTLSLKDAKRIMGRHIPRLSRNTPRHIKIAGETVNSYPIENVSYHLRNEDGESSTFNSPQIYLLKSTTSGRRSAMDTLPSIIGMDFLIEHNLAIYFDPAHKKAYLETTED